MIQDLRDNYLTIQAFVSGGRGIGHGSRVLYLVECDGKEARVFSADRKKHLIQVKDLELENVFDSTGSPVDWEIKSNTLTVGGGKICPWIKKGNK